MSNINCYFRLVDLDMSHFEVKSEPLNNVFQAILEIVICTIFSSYFERTLIYFLNFHLKNISALDSKNPPGHRVESQSIQKPAKISFLNEPVSFIHTAAMYDQALPLHFVKYFYY